MMSNLPGQTPSGGGGGGFRRAFDLDDEKQQDVDEDDDDNAVGMPMDDSQRGPKSGDGGDDKNGDGHEVRAKTDVAPEWNPYEDSDEEDGGKCSERQKCGGGGACPWGKTQMCACQL